MAGDPIKQAEEMLAEGVGLSEYASSMSVDKKQRTEWQYITEAWDSG